MINAKRLSLQEILEKIPSLYENTPKEYEESFFEITTNLKSAYLDSSKAYGTTVSEYTYTPNNTNANDLKKSIWSKTRSLKDILLEKINSDKNNHPQDVSEYIDPKFLEEIYHLSYEIYIELQETNKYPKIELVQNNRINEHERDLNWSKTINKCFREVGPSIEESPAEELDRLLDLKLSSRAISLLNAIDEATGGCTEENLKSMLSKPKK